MFRNAVIKLDETSVTSWIPGDAWLHQDGRDHHHPHHPTSYQLASLPRCFFLRWLAPSPIHYCSIPPKRVVNSMCTRSTLEVNRGSESVESWEVTVSCLGSRIVTVSVNTIQVLGPKTKNMLLFTFHLHSFTVSFCTFQIFSILSFAYSPSRSPENFEVINRVHVNN